MAIYLPVIVNGVHLDDGIKYQLLTKTQGLFEAIGLEQGSSKPTFDGLAKIYAQDNQYQARKFTIEGRLLNCSGFLSKYEAEAVLQRTFSGRPATVQIGSLYLEATFGRVDVPDDEYKSLGGYLTYRVEGEAIPGTFFGSYGQVQGLAQGIVVSDDRPDHPSYAFTSNSFTFTSPGTAPSEAVVSITGTASTTVYLKGSGDRRVPVNLDANGNGSIDAASGFLVYPGSQTIRIEDAAGALASGVVSVNFYGTLFRFIGNASSAFARTGESGLGNRFSEHMPLSHFRTGPANYVASTELISSAGDGVARIGVANGTYSSSLAGLLLEGEYTNILTSNQATCTDTLGDTTGFSQAGSTLIFPPGGSDQIISLATGSAIQGGRVLRKITTGSAYQGWETTAGSAAANTKHTALFAVRATTAGSAGQSIECFIRDETNNLHELQPVVLTTSWQIVPVSLTTGGSAVSDIRIGTRAAAAVGLDWLTDAIMLVAMPFAPSWVDGARNADLCALTILHNLVPNQDLSTWTATGVTVASGFSDPRNGSTAYKLTAGAADSTLACTIANPLSNAPYSFPIWLRADTPTTISLIHLYNGGAGPIQPVNLTTAWQRFNVSGTTPANCTSLIMLIGGSASFSTGEVVYAWHPNVHQASMPGVDVPTNGMAIPKSTDGTEWPSWMTQNGQIEFDVLPHTGSNATGKDFNLFGAETSITSSALRIARYSGYAAGSNYVMMQRRHNGSSGSFSAAGNGALEPSVSIWDGAKHAIKIVWKNYVLNGTRYMPMELWVDGTLVASQDVAALYGATAWVAPERLWLSDGNTFATLSDLIPSVPTLPAGAIPA